MRRQPGYALATILILLGVAMFSGAAIVTVSTLESKISASQKEGLDAYYVAEAGIESSLWKLRNNAQCGGSACLSQLQNNTLNYSFIVNGALQTNQLYTSFAATMTSTAPGQATIKAVGQVGTYQFTANRQIVSTVSYGANAINLGNSAIASGDLLTVTNGGTQLTVNGGDVYASTGITLTQASVSVAGGCFQTPNTYTGNSGPCIHSSNYPPPASSLTIPSYNFGLYSSSSTYSFIEGSQPNAPGSFEYAIENGQSNFNGDVYVSGSVSFNNKMIGKSFTVNGRLVINGSLSTANGLPGTTITLNDQGSTHSGLFVNGTATILAGQWNINGVLYSSGSTNINNSSQMVINGALIAGSSVSISTHANLTIAYTPSRVGSAFAASQPSVLRVKHWEESY